MTKSLDLITIRQELLVKKNHLSERKRRLAKEDPFLDQDRLSDNAAIDAEVSEQVGHDTVEALTHEINRSLRQVSRALKRLDLGEWGKCQNCGKDIEKGRLEIDPTVEKCVNCLKANKVV